MKKRVCKLLALVLALSMILPLVLIPTTVLAAEETELYREDFSLFSEMEEGTFLTREDGFSNDIPSTTRVQKDGDNTYLRVDLASANDPNETVYFLNNSTYDIVEEGTEGAHSTDAASFGLISGKDPNLDKNLQLLHPAVSHTEHQTVILESKYYLEMGSKGTIWSQLRTCTSGTVTKNYVYLYEIDNATGVLKNNGTAVAEDLRLDLNAWNTVSIVIDLRSGTADFYVNHVLHSTDAELGVTNMEIDADSFIVAKIQRTRILTDKASEKLSGSFGVDDVRIYIPGDETLVTVPRMNGEGQPLLNIRLLKGETLIGEYIDVNSFLLSDGVTLDPVYDVFVGEEYDGIVTTLGASLRTDEHGGIRFVSALTAEIYDKLVSEVERGAFTSVSFGTLIAPVSYIEEAGAFSFEALGRLDYRVDYLDVPAAGYGEWYFSEEIEANEGQYVFAGSIVGIDPSHYDDAFAGIGYVKLVQKDGTVEYGYAKWDGTSVTLHDAAKEMLASETELSDGVVEFLESAVLNSIEDAGGAVREISYAKDHLFFRVGENVYASLTYTGDGAWRLKAQADGYLGFTGMGAAQALAHYMNEETDENVLPITVRKKGDEALLVFCEDGSWIEIGIGENFFLCVFNEVGTEVSHLTDIITDGHNLAIAGTLAEGEAVFGGGEKFDSVNRRGMLTRLYSTDGWNQSDATYMVIPLFFTSRGGGFFFNRYEDMMADFGYTTEDVWTLTIKNDAMDCYLYATESGKEVISHYTSLAGNADIPDEWAYGVMLCRYSSDLSRFEVDTDKNNNDGAPSGRSVKTLVSNMINAGMKPSAVVMEAWNYQQVSTNAASRQELQDAADWLDEQGIKTMVYMRVGSSVSSSMPGYKEEYFVHANITENGKTTYTMQIPDVTNGGVSGNPDVSSARHIYLDITNPAAVEWYCDVIWGQLVEIGIDGVKIDFCETMPDDGYDYGGLVVNYDWYDPSRIAKGGEHHSYPVYFISTFYNRMNELKEAKGETDGFYLLSRGGGIGSQRNPFLWAGDQTRAFVKLDDQLMAVLTSGLSGVPFMTYDMAGYRYGGGGVSYADPNSLLYESEVLARSVEFTAFMVNIQTHGTVRNAYELSGGAQEIYKTYVKIHKDLSDYITKYVNVACKTGVPAVRHLVLEHQDDANVYGINDQFLLGEGLMVAPILSQNTYERSVYLPEGSWTNLLTGETLTGGRSYTVSANIGQVPVFLDNDCEDAEELRELFDNSLAWRKVVNWTAPLN